MAIRSTSSLPSLILPSFLSYSLLSVGLLLLVVVVGRPAAAAASTDSLADISAALDAPNSSADSQRRQADAAARLVDAVRVRRLIELLRKRKRRHQEAIAAAAEAAEADTEPDVEPAAMKTIRSAPLRLKSLAPSLSQNREILGWERLGWGW